MLLAKGGALLKSNFLDLIFAIFFCFLLRGEMSTCAESRAEISLLYYFKKYHQIGLKTRKKLWRPIENRHGICTCGPVLEAYFYGVCGGPTYLAKKKLYK